MTKTIKNITPRGIGDTFDVAYLTDLSAVNSSLSTKIDTLRQVIGGADWTLSSTLYFDKGGSGDNATRWLDGDISILSAFLMLDNSIGVTLGELMTSYYNIDSSYATGPDNTFTFADCILALDSVIGDRSTWEDCANIAPKNDIATAMHQLDGCISYTQGLIGDISIVESLGSDVATILDSLNNAMEYVTTMADSAYTKATNAIAGLGDVTYLANTTYASDTTNVTDAIINLDLALAEMSNSMVVYIEDDTATASSGIAAKYNFFQGETLLGTINIPKDFLVKSAALCVVTVADQPYAGAQVGDKYIDFVINAKDSSETADHIYLPVNDLVDVYTAAPDATEVQLAINSSTNVISAALVDSGVTTSKIADSAVTTAKVLDSAVTTIKINDSAVTTAKIADGAVNTNKIKLVDTADSSKAYTLQVTSGRLQVLEIQA